MILLNSLPDEEYGTFTLILINGKQTLNYSEVSAALINYEVRRQTDCFFWEYNSRGVGGKRQEFKSKEQR